MEIFLWCQKKLKRGMIAKSKDPNISAMLTALTAK
jgi:hypothetical protein